MLHFTILVAGIYTLLQFVPNAYFEVTNQWNASATAFFLRLLGLTPQVNGSLISSGGFTARVVGECSAVFISVLPLSFFLSYPTSPKYRFLGVFAGLPVLFLFNIIRIVFVFMAGMKTPGLFKLIHLYIGQVVMILLVIWICMSWLELISGKSSLKSAFQFCFKILCISILPFLIWVWLAEPYNRALLFIAKIILSLFDLRVVLPEALDIYPHTFISFNIVIILSLILVQRYVRKKEQMVKVLLGFTLLVLLHMLFQILPLLFYQYHISQTVWMINALLLIHQFVLPFVLWLIFIPFPKQKRAV